MNVQGKVVIVTGASSGIGLAAAKLLGKVGAQVVLAARSEEINNVSKEIPGSFAVITDVTKEQDRNNLIEKTLEKFGKIDVLVNNAGQGIHGFTVENTPIEEYKKIMDLNVFSVMALMQKVISVMKKQGSGVIVNISSKLSKMYMPSIAAYSSTKYALNAISLIARKELAESGIIVSLVLPGLTKTKFFENSINPNEHTYSGEMPNGDSPEKVANTILKTIESEKDEVLVE